MGFEGLDLTGSLLLIHFSVLIVGITSLIIVPDKIKPVLAIGFICFNALITSYIAIQGILYNNLEAIFNGGVFIRDIPFRIDALSGWFILIINIITTTGIIYGTGYLKAYKPQNIIITMHWIFFLLFQSSMLWVCMVQNSIAFLIAWEIMSVSSMFLVLFEHTNPKVLKAGINYMVQMHISVIFLTIAFIWVYFKTGTFDFKGIETFFGSNVNIWLFLLFFAGFGLKAGFIGLHSWLPHAHPAAPSHVSGVMSGVIVKMGIYGIFRIITFLKADFIILGEIVLTLSVLTGLFGIMNAAVHRDFKKMLAYCTIENIGIIGIGIGIGLLGLGRSNSLLAFLGFGGALLHVLNHSLFKSLLFYSAGSVYQQTHTRDMDKLGGLVKRMPQTAILFLIGAIAISGLPPFNGFISEFIIYCGLLNGIQSTNIAQITLIIMSFAGMSIIGGISILTFTKTFGTIFLGTPRQQLKHEPQEVDHIMLIPQYFLVLVMLTVAFFPGFFLQQIWVVLSSIMPALQTANTDIFRYLTVMQNISLFAFIFILVIGFVYLLRLVLSSRKEKKYESTWGCGYIAPTARIQYTGKSYSKSLGKLFNFVLIEKKEYKELKANEIFPETRKYQSYYLDFFEQKVINPIIKQLLFIIDLFKFIQNGKVQMYVLYGIIFIVLVFLGTILNIWH
jgi:formate hydrogenlyase subunit 3/multisubunit Na+/H+ antiporter MnhD subunit